MFQHWSRISPRIEAQLALPRGMMDPCDVDALWQLCTFEAGLQGNVNTGACALFSPEEAALLEWMDDVRLYETQGYGATINYQIAAPLLADIAKSLKKAAGKPGKPVQLARLMFAHCETLTPLATLMGLFKPTGQEATDIPVLPDFDQLQQHGQITPTDVQVDMDDIDSLDDVPIALAKKGKLPASSDGSATTMVGKHAHGPSICRYKGKALAGPALPPPAGWLPRIGADHDRMWRGGRVAPLGANMVLVLYRKENSDVSDSADGTDSNRDPVRLSDHRVRVVYNEQVVHIPGCSDMDCRLDEFLQVVVGDKARPDRLSELCGLSSEDLVTPDGMQLS